MKTLDEIKDVLAGCKRELNLNYKVKKISVFGSCVRGEAGKESDIDIMVDFGEDADLFDLTGSALFLEEKPEQKVDIVPMRALRDEIKAEMSKDLIPI